MNHRRTKTANHLRNVQSDRVRLIDELARYEEFKTTILPAIQADIKSGMSAEALREKYHAIVQAQLITTALSNPDPKARLTAAKDVLDRHEGTATQRIEQTHKLEKLPEEQLDAILLTELGQLKASTEDTQH